MTREETLEAIKIMQHYADGGEVEYYNSYFNSWKHDKNPYWDFQNYNYCIKKATKKIKLEAWLVDGVLQWHREDRMVVGANHSKRVPSEDKWVEVEE
jgi:hypothetical protein